MPRGGKRPNAGRPPALTYMAMLRVGSLCEEEWREDIAARLAALQHKFSEDDTALGDFWRQVHRIPVAERKAWLASDDARAHSEAIDEELSSQGQGRLVTFRVPAPYGVRKRIIARVAQAEGLTRRRVESAWKAYRQFVKEARAQWP